MNNCRTYKSSAKAKAIKVVASNKEKVCMYILSLPTDLGFLFNFQMSKNSLEVKNSSSEVYRVNWKIFCRICAIDTDVKRMTRHFSSI